MHVVYKFTEVAKLSTLELGEIVVEYYSIFKSKFFETSFWIMANIGSSFHPEGVVQMYHQVV